MKTYIQRAVELVVLFYAKIVENYDEFYGFISDDENWKI